MENKVQLSMALSRQKAINPKSTFHCEIRVLCQLFICSFMLLLKKVQPVLQTAHQPPWNDKWREMWSGGV